MLMLPLRLTAQRSWAVLTAARLASPRSPVRPPVSSPAAHVRCLCPCFTPLPLALSLPLPVSPHFPSVLQHLVIYIASLTRAVLALHDALNNRIKFREAEEAAAAGGEKKDDAAAAGAGAGAGDKKDEKKEEKKDGAKDKESK